MADEGNLDLIDVTTRQTARLESMTASLWPRLYGFDVQKPSWEVCPQYLPQGKSVFFVYTTVEPRAAVRNPWLRSPERKTARVLGEFSCKGYDTFVPSS